MNKKLFLIPLIVLSLSVQNAQAFFNWGFAFSDAPCCTYVEQAPTLNLGFATPLGDGGPSFGFNVGLPLGEPRRVVCHRPVVCHPAPIVCHTVHTIRREPLLDDCKCTYWDILNSTNLPIRVSNSNGESMVINSTESGDLNHSRNFKLFIRVGRKKIVIESKSHYITIFTDANGNIKISEK